MDLLLVEDNAAVARAIAKSLRTQGHDVTLLHSFSDAYVVSGSFDVGIFDITLTDGDGIQLCAHLLATRRVGGAVFCSGSIDDLLLERAEQIAPVVSKEASFWELYEAIRRAGRLPSSTDTAPDAPK